MQRCCRRCTRSRKTEPLAQRADFLFRTRTALYPRRILAISFKVDTARNLQGRLRSGPQYASQFDSFIFHAFAKLLIYNCRPALTGPNALNPDYRINPDNYIQGEQITFRELVPFALDILEANDDARGAWRQAYSHVFWTSSKTLQESSTASFAKRFWEPDVLLTGTGDIKQRIIGFAGALEGVMGTLAADFNADSLPLYQNLRSMPRLQRMQDRMVLDMDPTASSPERISWGTKERSKC